MKITIYGWSTKGRASPLGVDGEYVVALTTPAAPGRMVRP